VPGEGFAVDVELIARAATIEICKSVVPNTNPDFYNLKSKAGYGSWMHSNGEVCAITKIEIGIKNCLLSMLRR
jgi:hypothetical protein